MARLPAYVAAAPSGQIPNPPVGTRSQLLPLGELTWPDFERLCLRLIEAQGEVIEARLYGESGQDQEAIDFFARRADGTLAVYQCRRVKTMGPAAVARAITDFLNGEWADTATAFGICTSTNLSSTARARAVEEGRAALQSRGKELETWDVDRLSLKLKDEPGLVDDFFDRPWVIRFNGQSAADALEGRLGRRSAFRTRRDLSTFYSQVFAVHDAGVTLNAISPPADLRDLFVAPDLDETLFVSGTTGDGRDSDPDRMVPGNGPRDEANSTERAAVHVRIPADRWLSGRRRAVVTGEPGAGKSSCLRFLALDLLSEAPRWSDLAQAWGPVIPLWVPFGRWTELIQEGAERSLRGLLTTWLGEHGQPELVELYNAALEDGRAVLLVDGLDEWKTEASARIALNQLQVEASGAGVRVIATARPVALSRIGSAPSGWQTAQMAPLDRAQQLELLRRFTDWRSANGGEALDPRGRVSAEDFVDELQGAPDLRELAEVPLTLVFLHWIRVRDTRLPRDRFRAYRALVDLLLERYPATRSAAAGVLRERPDIGEEEFRGALGVIAFAIHDAGVGAITASSAQKSIRAYLRDEDHGPGLDAAAAAPLARALLLDAGDRLGVLFNAGGDRLAFLHRSVQEHLCAAYLARRPLHEQRATIERVGTDPRWAEVILDLIYLTTRPTEVDELVDALRRTRRARFPDGDPLLAEIASGGFGCSPRLAREIFLEAADAIETHARPAVARMIVRRLVDGLESSPVSQLLRDRLATWLPARGWSREWLYDAMRDWPDDPATDAVLWRAFFDEDSRNARAAALAYCVRTKRAGRSPDALAGLLDRPLRPATRAAVLEALGTHWPHNERLMAELPAARDSLDPNIRLVWLVLAVRERRNAPADLELALDLAEWGSDVEYTRRDQLAWALAQGWARSPRLKKTVMASASQPRRPRDFDSDVLQYVLLTAFPGDPDVVAWCIREIQNDHPFLGLSRAGGAWQLLAENFKDEPDLVAAADEWLSNARFSEPEVSFAALIGQTNIGKRRLLSDLRNSSVPHWAADALLAGWGLGDPDVRATLGDVALGEPRQAAAIGHVLPAILGHGERCAQRILDLLRQDIHRIDLLADAVNQIDLPGLNERALDLVLERPRARSSLVPDEETLFALAPDDPRVRTQALESLDRRDPNLGRLATAYAHDGEFREVLRNLAAPLSASLRLECVERLHALQVRDDQVRQIAAAFPSENDELVATTLGRIYALEARTTNRESDAVGLASSELRTGSPKWESHAQAALAVLLELGRLDVLRDATFVGADPPRPFSVPLTDYLRSNVALAALLVDHWGDATEVLGENFVERFIGISGSAEAFWDVVSVVADRRPECESALLRFMTSKQALTPRLLRFLSRVAPGSRFLRDACVNSLGLGGAGTLNDENLTLVVCDILSTQFVVDEDLGDFVLADFVKHHNPAHFLAIACTWPGERFARAVKEARRVRLEMPMQFIWRAQVAASEPPVATQASRELLAAGAANPRHIDSAAELIVHRLRRDDDLVAAYRGVLLSGDSSPSETASFGRLISLSTGLAGEVRAHLTEIVAGPEGVPIAYDLVAQERRPVAHSAADALDVVPI